MRDLLADLRLEPVAIRAHAVVRAPRSNVLRVRHDPKAFTRVIAPTAGAEQLVEHWLDAVLGDGCAQLLCHSLTLAALGPVHHDRPSAAS
uniref:Uncharacterized protein n=1 Tax=Ralstonia solanacearum TaxID=305 RepID=A0A0S4X1X6_RALSL|nr:protein of unknown function [Ralstonia solanacearum]